MPLLTSRDGTAIWAESAGDNSKPAVVFIHGLACTSVAFEKQFTDSHLLESLHMVRYEMRGHGRSGTPLESEAYESRRFAEDFQVVCETFGLVKPFILGWSLGGCTVVDVIDAYGPDYISGVMYIGGGVLSRGLHAECTAPLMRELRPAILSADAVVSARTSVAFAESCVANPERDLPFPVKLQWMAGFGMQSPQARVLTLERVQDESRWRAEGRKLPVLIVHGREDSHCIIDHMTELAKEIYDDVEVVVMEGIGHSPVYERPEETRELILKFVRRVLIAPEKV